MSVIEFARRFKITRLTVYSWIIMGMPAYKDSYDSRWLVPFEEAKKWLIANKVRFI